MQHKRIAAAEARAAARTARERERAAEVARAQAAEQAQTADQAAAAERARKQDVVPWLRALGYRADESRQAASLCDEFPDASLEQRVRVALSYFHLRGTRVVRPVQS
ncbi:MAG: RuvA C-terminal domain-containing protein, partial [Burkholderiales bacterium]